MELTQGFKFSANGEWKDLDCLNPSLRSDILLVIKAFIQQHPDAGMDHDPDWLYSKCTSDKSVKIFVCVAKDGSLLGYAPFFIHPSSLNFGLFGLSLFDYPIRRYSITAGPLLAVDHPAPQILLRNLFLELCDFLGQRDVLFGLGVEGESSFWHFLSFDADLKKKYKILPSGNAYKRRFIILPKSFDEYVKKLANHARQDVRRALRKVENDPEVKASYRVFTNPDEVPEFLTLAQTVSEKTYQKTLLDLGIRDNPETCRRLTFAAEKGWLRSYILTFKGEPVAMRHGFLYRKAYYAEQTGYDPRWSKWSVGTSIYMHAIRDLINIGVGKFDFLYGDNEKKRSLSNAYRMEQNFYLIPRRFPLLVIAYGLRLFNAIAQLLGDFMDKNDIKITIRRFLRKLATKKSNNR